MTQRNAYTPYDTEECTCYKCKVRREVKTFAKYLESQKQSFGGILPRNYRQDLQFNSRFPNNNGELSLELLEQIKRTIPDILKINEILSAKFREEGVRKTSVVHCVDCGKLTKKLKKRYLENTGYVCQDCASAFYKYCDHCSTLKKNAGFHRSPLGVICDTCFNQHYFRCQRCESTYKSEQKHVMVLLGVGGVERQSYVVCDRCFGEHHSCSVCGRSIFCSNTHFEHYLCMCDQCYSDRGTIKNYNYKPVPSFKSNEKTEKHSEIYFGVETEWEHKTGSRSLEDICVSLTETIGEKVIYFKRDGSINNGFEMVTHPFSFDWMRENKEKITSLIEIAHKMGMREASNCGIHVHVSKSAFTTFHLFKFIRFILSSTNRDFMVKVAERRSNNYCAYQDQDTTPKACVRAAKTKRNPSGNRHAAVNMTGPATMEIRIFASTTSPDKWFKNIEFLHSLYVYSRDHKIVDMTKDKYIEWLSDKSNEFKYSHVREFLGIDNPRLGKKGDRK